MKQLSTLLLFITMLCCGNIPNANADAIDDLQTLLTSKPQVQEKIYVHTDNSSYFLGDTLWYKAYVSRADLLTPTPLSKLLYVELLTSDGYLVERQHVAVSATGATCGQFYLADTLYSGFYEIRAYTRYQLNFNATEKEYTRYDRLKFYGKNDAANYFRLFEGLYSRVVPVYEKPTTSGDYSQRYMARRPKQNILRDKVSLHCSFFPEGGQMVEGVRQTVAFELTDNNGQQIDIEGKLSDGTTIRPSHMGRGTFTITPSSSSSKATFVWNDHTYNFTLPKAQPAGAVITLNTADYTAQIASRGVTPAAYSVLCRGRVVKFERLLGDATVQLPVEECPTGVNEIIVYDAQAQPLASRLFFVNHHDHGQSVDVTLTANGEQVGRQTTLTPYASVDIDVKVPVESQWLGAFSLAVRDAQTDERGYDNGNIMTDMLLSSELRGFIAAPTYYFESDDEQHRKDLDLLMMVQGWRRYKRVDKLQYAPERELTFSGRVRKLPANADFIELDDMEGVGSKTTTVGDEMLAELEELSSDESDDSSSDSDTDSDTDTDDSSTEEEVEYSDGDYQTGSGKLKRGVYVEVELAKDGEVAGDIVKTDKNGRFTVVLPAFYDQAVLFAKAYTQSDSVKKNMQSRSRYDKDFANERAFPDFFVQRDQFFPIYSEPFSWYQVNSPDLFFVDEDDDSTIPENSRLSGNHMLQTVIVKAKRRGKRSLDMTKPAMVYDMYKAYNDATDAGLMLGVADFKRLPMALATYYFGNMGRRNQFNIRAMIDGTSFYRNYTPGDNEFDKPATTTSVFEKLRLSRIKNVRFFTDYELRTDSGDVVSTHNPDVTIDFEVIPDNGSRYTYRDRRYVLDGLTYAEEFYNPDYSAAVPSAPTDYRRTLYWNPNVKLEADGSFHGQFFNNCRETRVTVSAAGLDVKGQMYYR